MKKNDFQDLIKSGQLMPESIIGKDQVERLLKRADKDLESASTVRGFDEAIAMECAYNGMFHAANALLRLHGLRPGPVRQHQGVIAGVSRLLGRRDLDQKGDSTTLTILGTLKKITGHCLGICR